MLSPFLDVSKRRYRRGQSTESGGKSHMLKKKSILLTAKYVKKGVWKVFLVGNFYIECI